MDGLAICKPQQRGTLSDLKRYVLEDSSLVVRDLRGNQDITREGDLLLHCPLLLEGFACCYKILECGERQIFALHLASHLCNLSSLLLERPSHSIGTLTPARVVFVPHATILDWTLHHPDRVLALWRTTLIEAANSQEWVVNVGRRTAYQRTAHLLCEFLLRMRWAGLAQGLACRMPFTQAELGDMLGLTAVHVNRILQSLRNEKLIDLRNGTLIVHDWLKLTLAAGFDPAYLHYDEAVA